MPEDKLNQTVSEEEKALREAIATAKTAMTESPSKEHVDAYLYATQALDTYLAGKQNEVRVFDNALRVVEYLNTRGWKIKSSKAYTDIKAGKLKKQADGTFLLKDVDKYAKDWLKPLDGLVNLDDYQKRKLMADADKAEEGVKRLRLRIDIEKGLYVLKSEREADLAARAAYLKTDLENFFHSYAAEIINIVEGNPEKTPDLLELGLSAVEDWLDRYAKQETFTI